jgi:hypothetical protein
MSHAVGSLAWAERTRGVLSRREQIAMVRDAMLAQIAGLPSLVRAHLGGRRSGSSALLEGRDPPESKLCVTALDLCTEASSPALVGHCIRCWYWADLFAQLDAIEFDPEVVYVAAVVHDLALTDSHRPGTLERDGCFATAGGELARRTLFDRGAEQSFANRVGDAVALHMNVRVPRELGGAAYLLHAAAHLDVAGTRAGDFTADALRQVLVAHPREHFAVEFGNLMRREARERPRSRAALLWRMGMPIALKANPLDRLT